MEKQHQTEAFSLELYDFWTPVHCTCTVVGVFLLSLECFSVIQWNPSVNTTIQQSSSYKNGLSFANELRNCKSQSLI